MTRAVPRITDAVRRSLADLAGARVLVACSYGPDSLALADAVLALRQHLEITPILVYVDHGLRPEAAAEGEAVRAFAAAHGVEARVVPVTLDRARGRGLEEAARAARYAALDALADELDVSAVLLGHTASDQAETLLMRLLRGAGAIGLAGMPRARGRYRRPLLDLLRADVEAYLAARGLTPAHDLSNDSDAFLRNRVRQTLLPALRRENPRADEALARAAAALRESADAIDWMAERADVGLASEQGAVRLDAARLAALPAAVAKRVIARAADGLGVSLGAVHLDDVLAVARRGSRGSVALALPGLDARREYGALVLAPRGDAATPVVVVEGEDGPYEVRTFQPGDRMRPASLRGRSRKLSDLYTDRKVPRAARARAVVVVRSVDGAIVWAEHVGPAYQASVRVALTHPRGAAINGGYAGARV